MCCTERLETRENAFLCVGASGNVSSSLLRVTKRQKRRKYNRRIFALTRKHYLSHLPSFLFGNFVHILRYLSFIFFGSFRTRKKCHVDSFRSGAKRKSHLSCQQNFETRTRLSSISACCQVRLSFSFLFLGGASEGERH